jgi:hypothetical protein
MLWRMQTLRLQRHQHGTRATGGAARRLRVSSARRMPSPHTTMPGSSAKVRDGQQFALAEMMHGRKSARQASICSLQVRRNIRLVWLPSSLLVGSRGHGMPEGAVGPGAAPHAGTACRRHHCTPSAAAAGGKMEPSQLPYSEVR